MVENHGDLSVFDSRYQNDNSGARAINPKLLLKVFLFACSRGWSVRGGSSVLYQDMLNAHVTLAFLLSVSMP
ncbi:MAG: hypothetical protein HQ525_00510 [Anaerolineae bacterium]|nr:hypothetical protein [Anaerolineae bacterium]